MPMRSWPKMAKVKLSTQAAFQDFMVPMVTIRSLDVDRVVQIFETVNSTGTRLGTVDFMRAITWDRSFDLNQYLDKARAPLAAAGFEMSEETIIKCVGLLLDVPPTPGGLMSLRTRTPQDLQKAFAAFPDSITLVTNFLRDRFKIESMAFVPYEGQILVLFRSVGMGEAEQSEHDDLERWFWATGFNESLRGKPDHYVVRAVENWRALVSGQIRGLEPRLRLSTDDFFDRRLIKGKALSASFAAMFATNGARSLSTGALIPTSTYMSNPDIRSFVTVYNGSELKRVGIEVGPSPRIFPNLVAINSSDEELNFEGRRKNRIVSLLDNGAVEVLASQFIDEEAAISLKAGQIVEFLRRRAVLLQKAAYNRVGAAKPASII